MEIRRITFMRDRTSVVRARAAQRVLEALAVMMAVIANTTFEKVGQPLSFQSTLAVNIMVSETVRRQATIIVATIPLSYQDVTFTNGFKTRPVKV